jgi:pimeloyl-ACP methyl ester carboxylesterase
MARTKFMALASLAIGVLAFAENIHGVGRYLKLDYPPSTATNELQLGVTYTLWIPDGVKTIRGVVMHQHGAGIPAAKSGTSAAYDLHWQALAKKWDCALLGPSYHVLTDKTDDSPGGSQLWFDPRRGSEKAFLKALREFAAQSVHPELETVPWVLWGHSGGGIWSHVMSVLHPERVAAMWLRSGSATMWRDKAGFPQLQFLDAVYSIPTMCNPGLQEKGAAPYTGTLATFKDYRAKGAPIGFAPDPLTGHWCGNSRYLAIPFLDACLAMRLPDKGSQDQTLKPVDMSKAWLAPLLGGTAVPAGSYHGDPNEAVWLPDESVAKDWMEYVKTGEVGDTTLPPAPFNVKVTDLGEHGAEIIWEAEADFESGIRNFIVLRDGQELGNLPATNLVRFQARPMFQAGWINSYNDAPADPVPEMRYVDTWPKDRQKHTYCVLTVNTVGLKSQPSAPASSQK